MQSVASFAVMRQLDVTASLNASEVDATALAGTLNVSTTALGTIQRTVQAHQWSTQTRRKREVGSRM